MDLDKALADINAIRGDVARGTAFRGYGPLTVALTGVFALLAALIQPFWVENTASYLLLWIATATLSFAVVVVEAAIRSVRVHAGLAGAMVQSALEHFAPAGVGGALLTFVLFKFAPEALWLVPGLWQMFFSLGVFASYRFLPKPMFAVGAWYLVTGLVCIAFVPQDAAFSPWTMGIPFSIGQFLMALVIHWGNRRTA